MFASLAIFTLGTAAAVVAPSLSLLIAARIIQDIGVGGVVPVGQAVGLLALVPAITLPKRSVEKALIAEREAKTAQYGHI